jgi:pantoate--beta-alanine ligase
MYSGSSFPEGMAEPKSCCRRKALRVVSDPKQFQRIAWEERCLGKSTALVPTMGFFHEGHLELMHWAKEHSDELYVSLFINPAQFAPHEDFDAYPRALERDADLARDAGVGLLFTPPKDLMYRKGHATSVVLPEMAKVLCGKSRPHFFRGVCTVVAMLLNISLPRLAVFGEKDRQQLLIIKRMARDLHLPTEVVGRPIVREADGLAMSSRNVYLSEDEREQAKEIYVGLQKAQSLHAAGEREAAPLLDAVRKHYAEQVPAGVVDYIELVDLDELDKLGTLEGPALLAVAVHVGKTRLIDNIVLLPTDA